MRSEWIYIFHLFLKKNSSKLVRRALWSVCYMLIFLVHSNIVRSRTAWSMTFAIFELMRYCLDMFRELFPILKDEDGRLTTPLAISCFVPCFWV